MDSIYGQTIECGCGKRHHIRPGRVIYAENALAQLPGVLAECAAGRRVAVLMDNRTRDVAGKAAAAYLSDAGWQVAEIIVPDPAKGASPVCDDYTHGRLMRQIESADVILSVGSGVLSDLGKWLASDLKLPCVSFATAASMNGYASANVAATINGVKTLLRKHPPQTILSDPAILGRAPYELTTAGLGDALAKSVSNADWRMNHFLFQDYYCQYAVALVADIEPLYLNHPQNLQRRRPEAVEALFKSLVLSGISMTMAETSAPASGGEHLISHVLDMMSDLDGRPHDLHGRQVGVGTVLACELYCRIISIESPDFSSLKLEIDKAFWGPLAKEVEKHFAPKRVRLLKAAEMLSQGNTWDRWRREMAPFLRSPDRVRTCLKQAGAAYRAEDIGCSRERLLQALKHAHEIRSRFTIIDLARLAGLLPQSAAEVIEQWA